VSQTAGKLDRILPTAASTGRAQELFDSARLAIREHLVLFVFVGLYLAIGQIIANWQNRQLSHFDYGGVIPEMTLTCLWCWMLVYPFHVMIKKRPDKLFSYMRRDLREVWLTPERICGGLIVFGVFPIIVSVYSSLKMMIPDIQPFCCEQTFEMYDRQLHFGIAPWRLLHPFMAHPIVSCFFNFLYNLWFFVLYGVLFWQAFSVTNKPARMQFLICFVLLWGIVGGPLAMAWSSAGPVYYERVTQSAEDPYAPLMEYLYEANESVPLWSLAVQEELWDDYQVRGNLLGGGISAMPSMHVASSILFALVGYGFSRRLGRLMAMYAFLIWLGSIHLGWHYAVDGYVSLCLTLALWWASGVVVRRLNFKTTPSTSAA